MLTEEKINNIIKETLNRYLKESIQEGFSFEELDSLNEEEKLKYCIEYLGQPLGNGSSRVVFEIDDVQVLKLAHDENFMYDIGQEQNKEEYLISRKVNSPLLTRVLYHADDWSWIISERVIPCTEMDLYKVLGISEYSFRTEEDVDYDYEEENPDMLSYSEYTTDKHYNKYGDIASLKELINVLKQIKKGYNINQIESNEPLCFNMVINHPWFKELSSLVDAVNLELGDIRIGNLGITLRQGKPYVVILDSGLTGNTKHLYQ